MMHRFSIKGLFVVLTIALIFSINSYCNDPQPHEMTWNDSLFLLKNILKDLSKEKKIVGKYKLFIRAESNYKIIQNELPKPEAKRLRKKLQQAFKKLPPPSEFDVQNQLRFTLQKQKKRTYYWSDPITEALFVDFLNKTNTSSDAFDKMIYLGNQSIQFDSKAAIFLSKNPANPVMGINYLTASRFTRWFSKIHKFRVNLPVDNMINERLRNIVEISCWTKSKWRENWEMFGGEFFVMFKHGTKIGELPEACYPSTQIYVVTSYVNGKKIYLKKVKSEL